MIGYFDLGRTKNWCLKSFSPFGSGERGRKSKKPINTLTVGVAHGYSIQPLPVLTRSRETMFFLMIHGATNIPILRSEGVNVHR